MNPNNSPAPNPRSRRYLSVQDRVDTRTNAAAANVVRGQIDAIYTQTAASEATTTPQPGPALQHQTTITPVRHDQQPRVEAKTYARSHQDAHTADTNQWQHYHSAWQDYYQKYYERYYMGHLYQSQRQLQQQVDEAKQQKAAPQPAATPAVPANEPLTKQDAVNELRGTLRQKLHESGKKVRRSKHFIPIAAASGVMLVFLFLQYNRVLFANVQAYVSPGNINPANLIVDPSTATAVSPEPRLIIPKINVDVPVDYTAKPDYDSQMKSMENGVAWFGIRGANAVPGQVGNTVLSGHSSNDVIDSGAYKFIFARLDQLGTGDTFYLNYNSKRYTYTVTKKEVVNPTDVNKLVYPTTKPVVTLITCTPLGTAKYRLLVTAEQVSPDPAAAAKPAAGSSTNSTAQMPGNSPTFVERIFGN